MLSYFRINDPYRLIGVFLLLLLLRISVFVSSGSQTIPELEWMIVGEKLAEGGMLYVDVWADIAPLSAWTYNLLDWMFGRSHLGYQILSFLLVCLQCALFNRLLLRNNVFPQNTYVPALIYGILSSLFFDFYTLSPVLLSITFILLAIGNILSHIQDRSDRDEPILSIGLFLGLASLFYLPAMIFFVATILVLATFTGTILRRYFLIGYGFLLPLGLVALYFFYQGEIHHLYLNLIGPFLKIQGKQLLDGQSFLVLLVVPNVFLIVALFRLLRRLRFSNYQISILRVMFLIFALTFVAFVLSGDKHPYTLMLFAPTVAFFISHLFLLMKRGLKVELAFFLFLGGIAIVNFGAYHERMGLSKFINVRPLLIAETKWESLVDGKTLLYLGDNISVYKGSKLATPYLNWEVSSQLFLNPNYHDNIIHIYNKLDVSRPQVIIDEADILGAVLERMPTLAELYRADSSVYILRP